MLIELAEVIMKMQMTDIPAQFFHPGFQGHPGEDIEMPCVETKANVFRSQSLQEAAQNTRLLFINIFQRDDRPGALGQPRKLPPEMNAVFQPQIIAVHIIAVIKGRMADNFQRLKKRRQIKYLPDPVQTDFADLIIERAGPQIDKRGMKRHF